MALTTTPDRMRGWLYWAHTKEWCICLTERSGGDPVAYVVPYVSSGGDPVAYVSVARLCGPTVTTLILLRLS